jgi:hypothetical protein
LIASLVSTKPLPLSTAGVVGPGVIVMIIFAIVSLFSAWFTLGWSRPDRAHLESYLRLVAEHEDPDEVEHDTEGDEVELVRQEAA